MEYLLTIDSRRHASKDRQLQVKALREKVQEGSLEILNP
jgi:hypothetical protein